MKKQLCAIGLAGLLGMSLMAFAKPNSTSPLENELENCYLPLEINETANESVVARNIDNGASPHLLRGSGVTITSVEMASTGEEDAKNEAVAINVKELISNLNYDRLGIAKVDNWLNIRQKPDINSKVVGKLPKNAGCNIYSVKKGWAKIKSGNVSGYVSAEYLVTDEEAEAYALEVGTLVATAKVTTLNVRFLPSTDSSKYTLIPEGEDLEVFREDVKAPFVKKFIENHFSGEDKKYIENVNQEAMLDQLDDWICVRLDNDKVFVSKEYVDISYQLKKAVALQELKEDKSTGVTSTRISMVEYAKQFLGNRYVWGGTSLTNGTDCSGFTMSIYAHFGYGLPRTSGAQANYTRNVSAGDVRPGDLFFYGKGGSVSHVAMYIGGGMVIHASNERDGIKISNAYYRTPIKIGRVIND